MSFTDPRLAQHPFLAGLEPRLFEKVSQHAYEASWLAGQYLLREGEPARASYLIAEGEVTLEIHDPARGARRLQTVGPGEVVGWSWIIPPHRWHFDARAEQPTRVFVLEGEPLLLECEKDHELGYQLATRFLRVVQRRIEAARMQLLDLYDHA